MSRGLRMAPEIDTTLKQNISLLDTTATRMTMPENTARTTMKNRFLCIAAELGLPVTVRKVPGGYESSDKG
jgi:hypothetical protein